MISQLANLNWISVVVASVAYFMLGYVWYVLLFSKQYKASLGKENETLPNTPIFMVGPAVCCLVYTVTSGVLMHALNIGTYGGALEFALIVGIGYLVTNTVNIAINPNIPRPIYYGVITGAYHLVGFTIANIILVAMR
jgi:hypothetical protein